MKKGLCLRKSHDVLKIRGLQISMNVLKERKAQRVWKGSPSGEYECAHFMTNRPFNFNYYLCTSEKFALMKVPVGKVTQTLGVILQTA